MRAKTVWFHGKTCIILRYSFSICDLIVHSSGFGGGEREKCDHLTFSHTQISTHDEEPGTLLRTKQMPTYGYDSSILNPKLLSASGYLFHLKIFAKQR